MIRQLAHICLGTRDLDRAAGFYQQVLGFETVHEFLDDRAERYGIFLSCGGRTFLELFNDLEASEEEGVFRHICFEVDDLETYVEQLRKYGFEAEIVRGRTDRTLQTWVFDPDGNKIEFQQYDEQSVTNDFLKHYDAKS